MHPRQALGSVALTVALLALAGCGSSTSEQQTTTADTATGPSEKQTPSGKEKGHPGPADDPTPKKAGKSQQPEKTEQSEKPQQPEQTEKTEQAEPAVPDELNFDAAEVSGGTFDARSLAGKDVVMWFWAPWCSVCAGAAADVDAAAKSHPDVAFVGVAGSSSDLGSMQQFVDQHALTDFPQLADTDGSLYTRFGVSQQHTFVLVSADGETETLPAYGGAVDLDATIDKTFG